MNLITLPHTYTNMEPESITNSKIRTLISDNYAEWEFYIAEEIRKDIDNEIMIDLLFSSAAYNYKHTFDTILSNDINSWCKSNLKNGWKIHNGTIIIESEQDNNWYILRWM
jgi:hypothetical protein